MTDYKLKVKLENCYGIKKLKYDFDFSKCHTFVIYAPNGVMKTSFAKTFDDFIEGKDSRDGVFNREPYLREFLDENGSESSRNDIFVIKSFVDTSYTSDKISTLLVRNELRLRYQEILDFLNKSKNELINNLANNTKSTDCEKEIKDTFSNLGGNFFDILSGLLNEISSTKFGDYDFRYNHVFENDVVKRFVEKNKNSIKLYYDKYFEILSKSDDFFTSDGSFGTAQANNILDSVEGDSFFKAGHLIILKNLSQIKSSKELKNTIDTQIKKILGDPELEAQFKKIDKALQPKNIQPFKSIIENNKELLLELIDYEEFQRSYWKSHLSRLVDEVATLMSLYSKKKKEIETIIQEADKESDAWKRTIKTFQERFVGTPLKIGVKNTKDSVLGLNKPELVFSFVDLDTGESKEVERGFLSKDILSQGERRAFYLLNIIFEIKARILQSVQTLFIIDDIADSFDYKNKYAIVEYLNDIASEPNFYSIILTHNYDFYRTITSRLGLQRLHKLYAIKVPNDVKIITEFYQKPPFITWRNCMKSGQYHDKLFTHSDAKKHILALIPFVRNLVEYGGKNISSSIHGNNYDTLTCLLHSKLNTKRITFSDLKLIFKEYLDKNDFDTTIKDSEIVYDYIMDAARNIQDNEFNLENKIVLAMAIRHLAEEYMWKYVANTTPISGDQTRELINRYKHDFPDINHADIVGVLESVNIMTPENIHINSFMYEPILDMGIDELKSLYDKVSDLVSK
jgi:hypothetical protein